jgi:hypothetical protein
MIAARTKVGTARARVITPRAKANTTGFGVVFRAAKNASGMLINTDKVVPITAIQIVSIVASITFGRLSKFGGNMYIIKFHNSSKPPNNVDKVMSMYVHDHTVAARKETKIINNAPLCHLRGARANWFFGLRVNGSTCAAVMLCLY